jgi:hypothetical protein
VLREAGSLHPELKGRLVKLKAVAFFLRWPPRVICIRK